MRRESRRCSGGRYRPRARRDAPSPLMPNVLGPDKNALVAAAAPPHLVRCPCGSTQGARQIHASMDVQVQLARYRLGLLRGEDLPDVALRMLELGLDSQ